MLHNEQLSLFNMQQMKKVNLNDTKDIDLENQNILIVGDNLEALKLLQDKSRKFDLIYMDPPYNTKGKDLKYKDTFKNKKWEAFIKIRLDNATKVLSDKGLLCISIDEKGMFEVKKIADESNCFRKIKLLAIIKVRMENPNRGLRNNAKIAATFEYLMIFGEGKNNIHRSKVKYSKEQYLSIDRKDPFEYLVTTLKDADKVIKVDDKEIEIYYKGSYEVIKVDQFDDYLLRKIGINGSVKQSSSTGKMYEMHLKKVLYDKDESVLFKEMDRGEDGLGYRWYLSPEKGNQNGFYFQSFPKEYRDEDGKLKSEVIVEKPWDDLLDMVESQISTCNRVKKICKETFKSCKPIQLMDFILNLINKDAVVLDLFAGSASLEEAIIKKNAIESTKINFIAVQKDENNIIEKFTEPRIAAALKEYKISDIP